jgi:hypothetical protein
MVPFGGVCAEYQIENNAFPVKSGLGINTRKGAKPEWRLVKESLSQVFYLQRLAHRWFVNRQNLEITRQ